jgi:hypothetical protein
VAASYAIEASPRAGGLVGGYNSVQVGVPVGDVMAGGAVELALFGSDVEVHPPNAAMHVIAIATTADEHSDRGGGRERHPSDERLAPGCAGVVTPSSMQPSGSGFPSLRLGVSGSGQQDEAVLRAVCELFGDLGEWLGSSLGAGQQDSAFGRAYQ